MPLGCPERVYRCLRADWNPSLSGEQRDKQILQDLVDGEISSILASLPRFLPPARYLLRTLHRLDFVQEFSFLTVA
jgi:hypothetical protein